MAEEEAGIKIDLEADKAIADGIKLSDILVKLASVLEAVDETSLLTSKAVLSLASSIDAASPAFGRASSSARGFLETLDAVQASTNRFSDSFASMLRTTQLPTSQWNSTSTKQFFATVEADRIAKNLSMLEDTTRITTRLDPGRAELLQSLAPFNSGVPLSRALEQLPTEVSGTIQPNRDTFVLQQVKETLDAQKEAARAARSSQTSGPSYGPPGIRWTKPMDASEGYYNTASGGFVPPPSLPGQGSGSNGFGNGGNFGAPGIRWNPGLPEAEKPASIFGSIVKGAALLYTAERLVRGVQRLAEVVERSAERRETQNETLREIGTGDIDHNFLQVEQRSKALNEPISKFFEVFEKTIGVKARVGEDAAGIFQSRLDLAAGALALSGGSEKRAEQLVTEYARGTQTGHWNLRGIGGAQSFLERSGYSTAQATQLLHPTSQKAAQETLETLEKLIITAGNIKLPDTLPKAVQDVSDGFDKLVEQNGFHRLASSLEHLAGTEGGLGGVVTLIDLLASAAVEFIDVVGQAFSFFTPGNVSREDIEKLDSAVQDRMKDSGYRDVVDADSSPAFHLPFGLGDSKQRVGAGDITIGSIEVNVHTLPGQDNHEIGKSVQAALMSHESWQEIQRIATQGA